MRRAALGVLISGLWFATSALLAFYFADRFWYFRVGRAGLNGPLSEREQLAIMAHYDRLGTIAMFSAMVAFFASVVMLVRLGLAWRRRRGERSRRGFEVIRQSQ